MRLPGGRCRTATSAWLCEDGGTSDGPHHRLDRLFRVRRGAGHRTKSTKFPAASRCETGSTGQLDSASQAGLPLRNTSTSNTCDTAGAPFRAFESITVPGDRRSLTTRAPRWLRQAGPGRGHRRCCRYHFVSALPARKDRSIVGIPSGPGAALADEAAHRFRPLQNHQDLGFRRSSGEPVSRQAIAGTDGEKPGTSTPAGRHYQQRRPPAQPLSRLAVGGVAVIHCGSWGTFQPGAAHRG